MFWRGRAAQVLVCGVLVCGVVAGAPVLSQAARPAASVAAIEVDLYLLRGGAELVPGGAADRAMTVINHGGDMAGAVELYYTTPVFINIDDERGLPAGCAMYYRNKDFHIPEIVKCTLSPLMAGERHDVSFPIKIADGAPPVPTYGTAIARSAQADTDKERNLVDNIARPGGTISLPPLARAAVGTTDRGPAAELPLLVTQSTTALISEEQPSMSEDRLSNLGKAAADNVRFIIVTPLYVNTSTAGSLPTGCSMVLTDPDPAVPEIVECAIGTMEPGQSIDVQIPVKAVPNGPTGAVYKTTILTPLPPEASDRHLTARERAALASSDDRGLIGPILNDATYFNQAVGNKHDNDHPYDPPVR